MATQRNHQNNFATNLTSNQIAGVTTTPLNSIPSIAAPFSIALDATNLNGKYEIVEVTSKTATNINHPATTYAHTTAEEVRMVVGATELDEFAAGISGGSPINAFAPQGFLQNGKISVTDAAGITVAIKTLAGTDPSATDPVYVRIGDTVRTISSALSHSVADGTNWLNAGSAELATKEIDYFVYLGYAAGDSAVHIGFARIPSAALVSDIAAGTTNEKGSCWNGTIAGTDTCENVGRFAATLSAGAGYTWSVPTYTAINLIQRPIYETRWLTWTPTLSVSAGTAPTYTTTFVNRYKIRNSETLLNSCWDNSAGGTAGAGAAGLTSTVPMGINAAIVAINRSIIGNGQWYESAGTISYMWVNPQTASSIACYSSAAGGLTGNDQSSASRFITFNANYEI